VLFPAKQHSSSQQRSQQKNPKQTDRLVRACAELPKLCEFFHIPFQSGDDDILREMKRGYTAARYQAIIDNIRRHMPDASVSGDAIVGFPGETEEQYLRTEALVRAAGFDRVNTAAYSPRPNTPAAVRDDQVADLIKSDRLNRLNAVVQEVATERSQRFLGRDLEVLVEGPNPKAAGQACGRTRHNKLAYFDGDGKELVGRLVRVRIEHANAYSLFGRIVEVMPPRFPLLAGGGGSVVAAGEAAAAAAAGAAAATPALV
jgi:tRNA-2-methylthio-N6-dimethylallyladenosine synthase